MTPDREVRALARALGCERRQVVEALQAHALWPEGEPKPLPRLQVRPQPARVREPAAPRPKEKPVRCKDYLRLVAARPCINCGLHGHSQAAHENRGKGLGLKVDDRRTFPLCSESGNGCHAAFDAYRLFTTRELHANAGRIWSAAIRAAIQSEGLWPEGLPKLEEETR